MRCVRLVSRPWWLALGVIALCVAPLQAQQQSDETPKGRFLKKVYEDDQGTHQYQVFLPAGYDKQKRYPTILYLHGADECGRDGVKPVQIGLGPYVRARLADYPFIVIFPQCETTRGRRFLERWQAGSPDANRALKILDQVEKDYAVDRSREILTGWSMGGYGAWSLAMAHPDRWAAVVPVSGGGDTTRVAALKNMPIWVFHGPQDRIVYPERSREMVAALKKAGGRVRYDEPKSEAHGVWQRAYDSQLLENWLKNPRQPIPDSPLVSRGTPLPDALAPFVPVAHIGGAAYLRVGAEVLDAIAAAIPTAVPEDILSGTLDSVSIKEDDGKPRKKPDKKFYEATLDDISYRGEIHAAGLSTRSDGTISVRMALKNITVTIGQTRIHRVKLDDKKVNGEKIYFEKERELKFTASASHILVGHQQPVAPVMLDFVVEPSVAKRRLKLKLVQSSFQIAPEQYQVIGPETIEVTGGFQDTKRRRVYETIVTSLAEQRGLVEEKIRELVPTLITEMEQRLEFADSSDLFRSLWPLPVYQPRVRLWPEAVAVEKSGLSIAIGMTVAAPDPSTAPRSPREMILVKDLVKRIPRTQTLRVGFAPGLLDPLTQMLIDGGVARVDVRDTPEELVRKLGDRGELSKVIPAIATMPATTELRCELELTRPISIVPTDESASAIQAPMGFRFLIPGARLIVSTRADGDWKPLAVFDLTLEHTARLKLLPRTGKGGQPLQIRFPSDPVIKMTGSFAAGIKIADRRLLTDVYRKQFDVAWRSFAKNALASTVSVSDFEFGDIALPLKDIGWSSPLMSIEFGLAPKAKAALRQIRKAKFEPPIIRPAPRARTAPGSPQLPKSSRKLRDRGSR